MPLSFDNLVVGAGFAGLTFAERRAHLHGETSLVVERRTHIGGNAYDHYDNHGVLIHDYGPHYFRTNSPKIREYLSCFTDWHPVAYEIRSWTDGRFWHFPINLNTFEQLIGRSSTTQEMEAWLAEQRVPIEHPRNSEEMIVSQVGWLLYEKFFKGYTMKQWRRHPRDLDASVCGRIPIRTNRDNRYLREEFQALPKDGYAKLFERMLASCRDRVQVMLRTDYRQVLASTNFRRLIYSGPIDEFFGYNQGRLPYRSLKFEPESFTSGELAQRRAVSRKDGFWQPTMQVNYPNDEEFTRIVEIKHATGQHCENTTIVREYPEDYGPGKEPYYPVPAPDAAALYRLYKDQADSLQTGACNLATFHPCRPESGRAIVRFIGRLATYRYYNMDQVVGMALATSENL